MKYEILALAKTLQKDEQTEQSNIAKPRKFGEHNTVKREPKGTAVG